MVNEHRLVVVLLMVVFAVSCGSDVAEQSPSQTRDSASSGSAVSTTVDLEAALAETDDPVPLLLASCPPEALGIAAPIFDWQELGEGQATPASAVDWFLDQRPDFRTTLQGIPVDVDAEVTIDFNREVLIPVRAERRLIGFLALVREAGGLLVGGAYVCDGVVAY